MPKIKCQIHRLLQGQHCNKDAEVIITVPIGEKDEKAAACQTCSVLFLQVMEREGYDPDITLYDEGRTKGNA